VTEKNKNLALRIASALLLLPLVLWLLSQGGYFTAAMLGVAAGICAMEYLRITLKSLTALGWVVVALTGLMPLLPVWRPVEATALVCAATGLVLFLTWSWHLIKGPVGAAPTGVAHHLMGFVYGHGGLTALAALRALPEGLWWVIAALVITWANDTAAYFFGRFLGRHKLYPEVSPNKTWEGFAGGFVGAIGGLFIMRAFFFPVLSVVDCVVLGSVGSILGPAGDLCESMLKRAFGVKDSGNSIPGHGGMLDRIDALIFNGPFVLLYVQFVRAGLP
jgi:phosphatidate cytidylyltransferase